MTFPHLPSPHLFSLASAPQGSHVRIVRFEAGRELLGRLWALGLAPGLEVELLASAPGPVILNVRGSRLILGQGMAARILVRPATCRNTPPSAPSNPCTPPRSA